MRSMVLEYERDPICAYLDKQYMLGDNLLVAPIFNDKGQASYYLPKGTWTNYFTGEKVAGNVWREEHHDYHSIPLMVRENSIIPTNTNITCAADSYSEGMELRVYQVTDQASTVVLEGGKPVLMLTIVKDFEKNTLVCKTQADKPYTLRFVSVGLKAVTGGNLTVQGNDSIVTVENTKAELVCHLA